MAGLARGKRLFDFHQVAVPVPWLPEASKMDPTESWLRRLNKELESYVKFTELLPEERKARDVLVSKIESIVTALYPGAYVASYGSFSTGLSGYWADVDIEVFFPPRAAAIRAGHYSQNASAVPPPSEAPKLLRRMQEIGSSLRQSVSTKQLEIRSTARVPIISGTDDKTGLDFDIGFGSTSGLANAREVSRYCSTHPEAKMLILVTKAFLRQRVLHQPFTGGMSGHMVFQLVRTYLDERIVIFPYKRSKDFALAQCLLEFFEFYGTLFNFRAIGFCADGNSRHSYFFNRETSKLFRRAVRARGKAAVISMIDPLCRENDIGLGAFNWPTIQRRFSDAYFTLLRSGGLCEEGNAPCSCRATWRTLSDEEDGGSCHRRVVCSILGSIVLPDAQGLLVRDKCLSLYGEKARTSVDGCATRADGGNT